MEPRQSAGARPAPASGRRTLVQMAGHGGAGKSTLARLLADHIGATVIDLDTIKSALLDHGAGWHDASRWSYSVIYALVDDMLAIERAKVVVDTPSYWSEIHERLTALAARHDADYVFVECDADESVRAQRLARRTAQRSQPRGLGVDPLDAPAGTDAVHRRPIQRPANGRCVVLTTDEPIAIDDALAQTFPA